MSKLILKWIFTGMILFFNHTLLAQPTNQPLVVMPYSKVSIHYTVAESEGPIIDSTYPDRPLTFTMNTGQLVSGLEKALMGKKVGETFKITLQPIEAYGERHPQLVQTMPISMFGNTKPQVGMQFEAATENGSQSVIIIDVFHDRVTVDANHPLAGIFLDFEGQILSIQPN